MPLVGAGQRVLYAGCDLSALADTVTHERARHVAESTAIGHATRRRVDVGLRDAPSVTLGAFYDVSEGKLTGALFDQLTQNGNTGTLRMLQHVLGHRAGARVLTYDNALLRAKDTRTTDSPEALVRREVEFVAAGPPTDEWVYGGHVDVTDLHAGVATQTVYRLGRVETFAEAERLRLDREEAFGGVGASASSPERSIEVAVHIDRWALGGSGSSLVSLEIMGSNGTGDPPFSMWAQVGYSTWQPSLSAIPELNFLTTTAAGTRRYLAPVLTVPANVTLTARFSLCYRLAAA